MPQAPTPALPPVGIEQSSAARPIAMPATTPGLPLGVTEQPPATRPLFMPGDPVPANSLLPGQAQDLSRVPPEILNDRRKPDPKPRDEALEPSPKMY